MIYGIIVFGLQKGSGIHRKGFRMFPEMFGYENTLFGPRGKAHEALGRCKRSFAEARGQTPGTLASGARRRGPWRLVLESEEDSCLAAKPTLRRLFLQVSTPGLNI